MVYLIALLQLADIATTHYALRTGIGKEANPFLKRLFDKFGHEPVLLVIKGAFIALLWWAAPIVQAAGLDFVLWAIAIFYAWVVFNNTRIILKQ